MNESDAPQVAEAVPNKKVTWLKRLGVAGFLFFFIKGMLWLIVPAVLVWWGASH